MKGALDIVDAGIISIDSADGEPSVTIEPSFQCGGGFVDVGCVLSQLTSVDVHGKFETCISLPSALLAFVGPEVKALRWGLDRLGSLGFLAGDATQWVIRHAAELLETKVIPWLEEHGADKLGMHELLQEIAKYLGKEALRTIPDVDKILSAIEDFGKVCFLNQWEPDVSVLADSNGHVISELDQLNRGDGPQPIDLPRHRLSVTYTHPR